MIPLSYRLPPASRPQLTFLRDRPIPFSVLRFPMKGPPLNPVRPTINPPLSCSIALTLESTSRDDGRTVLKTTKVLSYSMLNPPTDDTSNTVSSPKHQIPNQITNLEVCATGRALLRLAPTPANTHPLYCKCHTPPLSPLATWISTFYVPGFAAKSVAFARAACETRHTHTAYPSTFLAHAPIHVKPSFRGPRR